MSRRWALAVTLGVVFIQAVSSLICEADCINGPPLTTTYPALVAHICNCSEFYLCMSESSSSELLACPPDNPTFDPAARACGPLNEECVPTITMPTGCSFTCSDADTTILPGLKAIAEASNCSQYYMCGLGGQPLGPYSCPSSLPAFNGHECVADMDQCCTGPNMCEAICYEALTQIPDPYDCTKYYVCIEIGPAEELYHKTCSSGMNFDPQLGVCSADAPCSPLCATSSEGGSSTSGGGGEITNQPTGDCVTSMVCTEIGDFPKCLSCDPQYFHCSVSQGAAETRRCTGDLVFNPVTDYPYCVLPTNCPYQP